MDTLDNKGQEILKENQTPDSGRVFLIELKNKFSLAINNALNSLYEGSALDNETLSQFINFILQQDGWQKILSVNPDSRGKVMEHTEYGKFMTGMVDENDEIILDESGVPDSFSFLLKNGGNLVRLKGGNIRFTGRMKK